MNEFILLFMIIQILVDVWCGVQVIRNSRILYFIFKVLDIHEIEEE